jgi:very-short-patch-repair endonuclease
MRSTTEELMKRVADSMGLTPESKMTLSQEQLFKRLVWCLKRSEDRAMRENACFRGTRESFGAAVQSERSESPIEEVLMLSLNTRSSLIGEFVQQYEVGPYRMDFAFPRAKLYVEADGRHHRRDPAQIAHDQKRGVYLASLGWTVLRFTGQQIYESSAEIAQRVEKVYQTILETNGLPEAWDR